jgi:hypothetical protein
VLYTVSLAQVEYRKERSTDRVIQEVRMNKNPQASEGKRRLGVGEWRVQSVRLSIPTIDSNKNAITQSD